MVSAVCPNCKILLVEATTNLDSDLYAAEDTAARLGADAISNSWGGDESSDETANDVHFNHPGIAITASSGDDGFGVSYPAASPFLTAVGGTSLTRAAGTARGWTESAWDGAGSGCSAFEAKPAFQTDAGCARRTVADVSAVADPNTGVNVLFGGMWLTVGGTSASSPIIASVYALAGNTASANGAALPVREPRRAVRRDERQQRDVQPELPLHRPAGLRRADRPGHAQRGGRLLGRGAVRTGVGPREGRPRPPREPHVSAVRPRRAGRRARGRSRRRDVEQPHATQPSVDPQPPQRPPTGAAPEPYRGCIDARHTGQAAAWCAVRSSHTPTISSSSVRLPRPSAAGGVSGRGSPP